MLDNSKLRSKVTVYIPIASFHYVRLIFPIEVMSHLWNFLVAFVFLKSRRL
jgi:hypothetical protein